MIEFGTTPEQLGHIPLACRERANANPRAQMHDRPLTIDDYLASRMISDAAAAVRLLPRDRRRVRRRRHHAPSGPRDLAATAGAHPGRRPGDDPEPAAGHDVPGARPARRSPSLPATAVADVLYRRAGLGPADIDVAQFYDCFSITVLLQLEDWGFCAKGEGGPFVASGAIDLGGSLPINTGGGHLSEGYIHGLNHVARRRAPDPRHVDLAGRRRRDVPRHRPRRCRPAAP